MEDVTGAAVAVTTIVDSSDNFRGILDSISNGLGAFIILLLLLLLLLLFVIACLSTMKVCWRLKDMLFDRLPLFEVGMAAVGSSLF